MAADADKPDVVDAKTLAATVREGMDAGGDFLYEPVGVAANQALDALVALVEELRREREETGPFFVRDIARLVGLSDDASMDAIAREVKALRQYDFAGLCDDRASLRAQVEELQRQLAIDEQQIVDRIADWDRERAAREAAEQERDELRRLCAGYASDADLYAGWSDPAYESSHIRAVQNHDRKRAEAAEARADRLQEENT